MGGSENVLGMAVGRRESNRTEYAGCLCWGGVGLVGLRVGVCVGGVSLAKYRKVVSVDV